MLLRSNKLLAQIGVLHNGKIIRYEALIDSGTDFNIFNAEIGELLGLNIKNGKEVKFSGIAGEPFEVYIHKIIIEISGWQYEVMAGFFYKISPYGFGILGQKGFFDLFRIKFIYSKGAIEITPENKKTL
jgi:hypothetical protein